MKTASSLATYEPIYDTISSNVAEWISVLYIVYQVLQQYRNLNIFYMFITKSNFLINNLDRI